MYHNRPLYGNKSTEAPVRLESYGDVDDLIYGDIETSDTISER